MLRRPNISATLDLSRCVNGKGTLKSDWRIPDREKLPELSKRCVNGIQNGECANSMRGTNYYPWLLWNLINTDTPFQQVLQRVRQRLVSSSPPRLHNVNNIAETNGRRVGVRSPEDLWIQNTLLKRPHPRPATLPSSLLQLCPSLLQPHCPIPCCPR